MPNTLIPHPTNGTFYFGLVEERTVRRLIIPGAPIVLKRGKHSGRAGYGVRHIWWRHAAEMRERGYESEDDVAKYVAEIVCPGSPIYCEFDRMKDTRVAVIRSAIGLAVLEHKPHQDHYSVVTAYAQRNAHGTRIGTVSPYHEPEDQG